MTYTAEFDAVGPEQWDRLLLEFDDANLFQTWAYGSAHWGEHNLSHAVIKKSEKVVGLAQTVLIGVPLLGKVLAYVSFGPVCQRRDTISDIEDWQATIGALREEYVVRRGLCLRLRWWASDLTEHAHAALLAEGVWNEAKPLHKTYILDLSLSEDQLRSAMEPKWRANLRKVERCGLVVRQRNDRDGVGIFLDLHQQMRRRKCFSSGFVGMIEDFYLRLGEELRPRIFVCYQDERPIAAAIVTALGNRAFYLNAATGVGATKARAGYCLQWAIICWLKENPHYRWYDLHGSTSDPGVARFKRALVGPRSPEIAMAEFQTGEDRLKALIIAAGTRLYDLQRQMKAPLDRLRTYAYPIWVPGCAEAHRSALRSNRASVR